MRWHFLEMNSRLQMYFELVKVLIGVTTIVDGDNVREFEQLVSYLEANTLPGDNIVLEVIRNGTNVELNAIMGERPPPPSSTRVANQSHFN